MASQLAHIDVPEACGPFQFLHIWIDEYKKRKNKNFLLFNLATSSKNGDVTNRYIALKEVVEDGIIFNTNSNSTKARHITENPKVSLNFMFLYSTDVSDQITRQVRIEGMAEQLSKDVSERIYNEQPLPAKIRGHFIQEQGVEVKWEDLKRSHDEFLEKVNKGEVDLKMPDHIVAYKIVPKRFEFYHAAGQEIADKVLFVRDCHSGSWNWCHITA